MKYLKRNGADVLEETYEANIEAWIPEKPHPTIKGVDVILRAMAVKEPSARSVRPEQFVDVSKQNTAIVHL